MGSQSSASANPLQPARQPPSKDLTHVGPQAGTECALGEGGPAGETSDPGGAEPGLGAARTAVLRPLCALLLAPARAGTSVRPGASVRCLDAPLAPGTWRGRLKCKLRKLTFEVVTPSWKSAQGPPREAYPDLGARLLARKSGGCQACPLQFSHPGLAPWKLGTVSEEAPSRAPRLSPWLPESRVFSSAHQGRSKRPCGIPGPAFSPDFPQRGPTKVPPRLPSFPLPTSLGLP